MHCTQLSSTGIDQFKLCSKVFADGAQRWLSSLSQDCDVKHVHAAHTLPWAPPLVIKHGVVARAGPEGLEAVTMQMSLTSASRCCPTPVALDCPLLARQWKTASVAGPPVFDSDLLVCHHCSWQPLVSLKMNKLLDTGGALPRHIMLVAALLA